MQYTESDLAKLIETVEIQFTDHLNKHEEAHKAALSKSESTETAPAPLAKAEDSAPPKKEEKKDEKPSESKEAAPEKKEDAAPKADAHAEEKPAAEGEAHAAPHAEGKEAAPAPAEGEAHGYDAEDMEHMHKMYASMSKAERKAHHDCIMKIGQGEMDKCGDMSMGKSEPKTHDEASGGQISPNQPKGSPGAKSPASTDQGNLTDMEKSEQKEGTELLKSELEAEKAKSADLKKSLDAVSEFLTKFVSKIQAPKGKAITEVAALAKSEGEQGEAQLSKSEVNAQLMKKAQDPNLSKSDREAINAYYLNGTNVNTISHLLKN